MGQTDIQWTATYHADGTITPGQTINPIRARIKSAAAAGLTKGGYNSGVGHYCEKISEECAFCYASDMQHRFGMPGFPGVKTDNPAVDLFFDESKLQEVLKRKKPCKWFWCDMTDMFGRWVPDDWIHKCFATMAQTPQHVHQVLTKRIDRAESYLRDHEEGGCSPHIRFGGGINIAAARLADSPNPERTEMYLPWPLPNVWLGSTMGSQAMYDQRLPHLKAARAAVKFISVEPLLTGIVMPDLSGIDWVIVGCESRGPRAGRFADGYEAAARKILQQCAAAGVAAFHKQNVVNGQVSGDPKQWPDDIRIRQFPQVAARQPCASN